MSSPGLLRRKRVIAPSPDEHRDTKRQTTLRRTASAPAEEVILATLQPTCGAVLPCASPRHLSSSQPPTTSTSPLQSSSSSPASAFSSSVLAQLTSSASPQTPSFAAPSQPPTSLLSSISSSSVASSSSTTSSASTSSSSSSFDVAPELPVTPAAPPRRSFRKPGSAGKDRLSKLQPVPFFLTPCKEEEDVLRARAKNRGRLFFFGKRPDDCTTIDCLPDNVLLHIFSFLSEPRNIRACFSVCQRWNTVLSSMWFSELHYSYPRHLAHIVDQNLARQHSLLPSTRVTSAHAIAASLSSSSSSSMSETTSFFSHQTEITPFFRRVLYNWLFEVCDEFRYINETVYMAAHYVDSFLSSGTTVSLASLQLVGVASLWISTKLEEVEERPLAHFVKLCADLYTRQQLVEMERVLLTFFNFDVLVITRYHLLQIILCRSLLLRAKPVADLAQYLCHMSLLDESLASHSQTFIALVCALLAVAVHPNSYSLAELGPRIIGIFPMPYCPQVVADVCRQLASFLSEFRGMADQFLIRKYSTAANSKVALLEISQAAIDRLHTFLRERRQSNPSLYPLYTAVEHEDLSDSSDEELASSDSFL